MKPLLTPLSDRHQYHSQRFILANNKCRGTSRPAPPAPPPSPTHSKIELDEQWRTDLRKRIEHNILHMVEGTQIEPFAGTQLHGDTKRGSDENFEDRYRSGGREYGIGPANKSGKRTERKDEGGEEDSTNPRKFHPPSRPGVPLTQPSHSRSPVPQRNASPQRQPPNFQPAEDNDDEDVDSSNSHPARRPYFPFGLPRSQASSDSLPSPVWRPVARAPEPGISRTLAHATGQISIPSQISRHGSARSTGSTSRGAGHHHAASLNSDRYPSALRERQTSASVSPHARPSLGEAVRSPMPASPGSRAVHGLQHSPENIKQGIPIPRVPTLIGGRPEGPSWGSLNSDVNVLRRHNSKGHMRLPHADGDISDSSNDIVDQHHDRHCVPSIRIMRSSQHMDWEQMDVSSDTEEVQQPMEEVERHEGGVRQTDVSSNIHEAGTQKKEVGPNREKNARTHEAEARTLDAEVKRKEAEAKKKEAEAEKCEAEAHTFEAGSKIREAEAQAQEARDKKREAEAQAREAEDQRREAEALVREAHDLAREAENQRREAEAQTREAVAQTREAEVRTIDAKAQTKKAEAQTGEPVAQTREAEAQRSQDEFRHSHTTARPIEEEARTEDEVYCPEHPCQSLQAEADSNAADAVRLEADAQTREASAQCGALLPEERTRQTSTEAERLEADAYQAEASTETHEAATQLREGDAKSTEAMELEAGLRGREAKVRLREEEASQREEKVRHLE